MIQNFFYEKDQEEVEVAPGVTRKILACSEKLMVCQIHFKKGAVGALHSHFHDQCSYVVSGKFEMEVGGVKKILTAGDSTYKQPDIVHGGVCLEEGVLLDIFTPCREDFLKK